MGKLNGKIALVTGASKGIGAGVALSLAKEGAAVAVNYASDRVGAERVVEGIRTAGGKAIAIQGSVTSSVEIGRFFDETEKQFGAVDVLVNNAGVFAYLPLQDVNEGEFRRQFDTNVLGLLVTSKRAAQKFGEKGGSIINIGSVASTLTPPASSIYAATKSAVDSITRVLAKELGAPKYPRELDQSRGHRYRRRKSDGHVRASCHRNQSHHAARSHRHARRHRLDRCFPRVR